MKRNIGPILLLLLLTLLSPATAWSHPQIPSPPQKQPVALTNATIHPVNGPVIEKGMLVELDTMQEYAGFVKSNCMRVIYSEILNKNCAKTWDLGLDLLKNKRLWQVAKENGSEFVDFLQAFRAMRAGFASGNFVYGLIVAKKL